MSAIQVVLVLAVGLMLWAFRNRSRVGLRAGARVMAILLSVLAILAIVDPRLAQEAADLLGVTRGTDLLLYALVIVFAGTSLGIYFRFRELEHRMADITRTLAIREAVAVQGIPDGTKPVPLNPGAETS